MFEVNEFSINWYALRVQKIILLGLSENRTHVSSNESDACGGLINFLDDIQDHAMANGLIPEGEIFTYRELQNDGMPEGGDINDAPFVIIDSETDEWLDAFMTEEKAKKSISILQDHGIKNTRIVTGEEWKTSLQENDKA